MRQRAVDPVLQLRLLYLLAVFQNCATPVDATCPDASFRVAPGDTGDHFPNTVGRAFYANDMCGADAGSASVSGVVGVTQNSDGQTISSSNVGALSGGGAGCSRRLEMITWPAGTEDYSITTIATSSSTSGGSTDFIGGPAVDLLNGFVYYIRTDTVSAERILERYAYETGETQEMYRNTAAEFPTPQGATFAATFQLVINVDTQTLYWFVQENIYRGWVRSLDVSQWTQEVTLTAADVQHAVYIDETPPLGGATVMTNWFAMSIDCSGNLYFAFYKKISKWNPEDGPGVVGSVGQVNTGITCQ